MTKQYDPPGITDPENVDALTHQQIIDAFNSVVNSTSNMIKVWKQGHADFRDSTTSMLAEVRKAVDGNWTGAAADSAVSTVAQYCNDSAELDELFDEVSQVVGNTAMTAVMSKSFLPPVVSVTADQNSDPEGYDQQTREAETAQAEARRIMQERYVVGFQEQDKKLPTFPPAMAIGEAPGTETGGSPVNGGTSGTPNMVAATNNPAEPGSEPEAPAENPAASDGSESPTDGTENSAGQGYSASDGSETDSSQADSTQAASASPSSAIDAPTGTSPTSPGGSDPSRSASPLSAGSGGGSGTPGGQGISSGSPVPAPGAAQPGSSAGSAPGGRTVMPAAANAAGTGMHGMPGAAGRPAGKGEDQEKSDKKVDLSHGDHTTELLGVIKSVPPVLGDR